MNAAFLSALKSKASQIQKDRSDKPINGKTYNLTGSGNSIMNGNSWAESEVKPETPKQRIDVNLVLNKNRIDLKFALKPDEATLDLLRNAGWHYRPTDRAWFHKDEDHRRQWINDNFGTEIEMRSEYTQDPINDGSISVWEELQKAQASDPVVVTDPDPVIKTAKIDPVIIQNGMVMTHADTFEIYKRQIDDLLEHLGISPADLQVLAISKLHDQMFK